MPGRVKCKLRRSSYLILLSFIVLFSTTIPIAYGSSDSVSLLPIADSYASSSEGEEDSNFGGKSYMEISNAKNMFVGKQIGYIMFDLSDIPTGSTINSAVLKLKCSSVTETHTIGIHYCSNTGWEELEITWDNKPSYKDDATSTQRVGKEDWYEWTVTSDVSTALGNRKITLVVKSETRHDTAWIWFNSRDQEYSWMEKYRPKLEIEYTEPSTGGGGSSGGGGIPGFPWEGIAVGIALAVAIIISQRKPQVQAKAFYA